MRSRSNREQYRKPVTSATTDKLPAAFEDLGFAPLEVKVTGSFEDALRRFKMYTQSEGILSDWKERSRYEKPSEKRRRKDREAESKKMAQVKREAMMANGEWEKRQKRKEKRKKEKMEAKIHKIEENENDNVNS